MPCMESIKEFDWKKNWIWIALGICIFVVLIVVIIVVLAVAGALGAVGRGLGLSGAEEYQTYGLELHNQYRAKHKAPPLTLNKKMNALAVKCAEYYVKEVKGIDHSCPYKEEYAENLSALFGPEEAMEGIKSACDRWYAEIKHYDFKKQGFTMGSGHFTCMVWIAAKELGIGHYKSKTVSVRVALYDPHCNLDGRYEDNVMPPS